MATEPVTIGEQTGPQKSGGGSSLHLVATSVTGDTLQIPGASYDTYRKMRENPTISLARTVATAPIRSADISWEFDEDMPEEHQAFIRGQIDLLWPQLVKDMLYALDYGFAAFEAVWESTSGGRLGYARIKPLLPDKTSLLVDQDTGAFGGVEQKNITLTPDNSFVFTYDGEAGYLYGRSRHENIRTTAYAYWKDAVEKYRAYLKKVAFVIPLLEYPKGQGVDKAGATVDNFTIAKKMLQQLTKGEGVVMPNELADWAGDIARSGADPDKYRPWKLDFVEAEGASGDLFASAIKHYESLMLRGWLVPERAAIEGTHGTKAEAGEHGSLVLTIADLVLDDMLMAANAGLVDPLMRVNYGPDAVGTARMISGGLSATARQFFRDLVKSALTNPQALDLFFTYVDINALLEMAGVPPAPEEPADEESLMRRLAAAAFRTPPEGMNAGGDDA